MFFSPKHNLYLPRRYWPSTPKRQRGSIGMAIVASLQPGTVWTLTGLAAEDPITDTGGATTTYGVSVVFRTDGTVDITRDIGGNTNDVDDYVLPAADVSGTWVRCTHQTGTDMTGGAARGTWWQCSTERVFQKQYTSSGGEDTDTGNFDFELASDSGGSNIVAQALAIDITVGELF